ncbi:MAG: sugar transferase [Anaerolineae bacterium]|nr:sugar transferase [Anaerolineae bacterium]
MTRRQLPVSDRRGLLMVGDTLAILVAVLLSLAIWIVVDGRGLGLRFILTHAYWFPVLAALWLLLAHTNDFYNLRVMARVDTNLARLLQVTLQMLVVYLVIFFVSPRDTLPRLFILYYGVLSFTFTAIWRLWRPGWAVARRRALIIGSGQAVQTITGTLRQDAPDDYEIAGVLAESDAGDVLDTARQASISEIILAHEGELSGALLQAVLDCYEQGVSIIPMPVLYEQITGRVPVAHIGPRYWLLPITSGSIFAPYPPLKRGLDIGLSLIGLGLFTVLLPFIALVLWLDSRGSIFFRQARIGQGGRVFKLWKLRTMIPNAEAITGPQWASRDDPRITRIGRLLRRTRLDEVPQLINVLRGEMSLIGPRPERPEFVQGLSEQIPYYRARHAVKPGITGWAQVSYPYGSSDTDARIKLEYDLYYIRHRSLALDLVILLRTAGKMVSFQGR